MKDHAEELLSESIDFHLHASPDPYKERCADAYEVARQAKALGMKGFVFKSHAYPTTPLAEIINKVVPGIEAIGSITLNREVGGINPQAVEASAKMGCRMIWMPTLSCHAERQRKGFDDGISIFGADGGINPETREVLALAREYDMALGTGHLVEKDIVALFEEAQKMGFRKFVLTHPLKVAGTIIDLRTQKELAERGAFIEHCYRITLPYAGKTDPIKIVEAVRFAGVEHCILSTDFGNLSGPAPWDGMRDMLVAVSHLGLSDEEIDVLVKDNPSRLLNV